MLAHIRAGEIVRRYMENKGWVDLANGQRVSPPVAGYTNGVDSVVLVVDETVDNSTHSATVTHTAFVVEADRVVHRKTISDLPDEALERSVRNTRDDLLLSSDWVVVKAYEEGMAVDVEWVTYRSALRDVTDQVGFPHTIVWPVAP